MVEEKSASAYVEHLLNACQLDKPSECVQRRQIGVHVIQVIAVRRILVVPVVHRLRCVAVKLQKQKFDLRFVLVISKC